MKSQPAKADWLTDPEIRDDNLAAASGLKRFFSTSLVISFLTQATPLSTRSWSRSVITTGTFRFLIIRSAN